MGPKSDLSNKVLYEAVKQLVEEEQGSQFAHFQLTQHKLYTLSSIAFQYMLYTSTKNPGYYVIRFEDGHLADKISTRAKDETTRKFLSKFLIPRKMKYGKSTFLLDYFHMNSWGKTNEIPDSLLQGSLIIKNTSDRPLQESLLVLDEGEEPIELPPGHFFCSLRNRSKRSILISTGEVFDGYSEAIFSFITKEEKQLEGVTINCALEDT